MKTTIFTLALFLQTTLFADDALSGPPEKSFWHTIWMLALAALLFYVILFRPEQKRRKALEAVRDALKVGDRVNAMGIIGTVAKIEEDTVILRMYDGTKLEFLKGAVTEVLNPDTPS